MTAAPDPTFDPIICCKTPFWEIMSCVLTPSITKYRHRNRKLWVEGGLEGAGSEAAECWAHQSWAAGNHGRPSSVCCLWSLTFLSPVYQLQFGRGVQLLPLEMTGDRCPMVAATVTTSAHCSGFIAKMLPPHPQQNQFSYLNFSINNLE